jgi:hypothetical protein
MWKRGHARTACGDTVISKTKAEVSSFLLVLEPAEQPALICYYSVPGPNKRVISNYDGLAEQLQGSTT